MHICFVKFCSFMHKLVCSPGLMFAKMHVFYVEADINSFKSVTGCKQEGESIKTHHFTYSGLMELFKNGDIINAHTIMLINWFQANML